METVVAVSPVVSLNADAGIPDVDPLPLVVGGELVVEEQAVRVTASATAVSVTATGAPLLPAPGRFRTEYLTGSLPLTRRRSGQVIDPLPGDAVPRL
jgi:hypothetical protein